MSRGFPSMTALLGLLAVAGYQNRDKIAEWLGAGGQAPAAGQTPQPGAQGAGRVSARAAARAEGWPACWNSSAIICAARARAAF